MVTSAALNRTIATALFFDLSKVRKLFAERKPTRPQMYPEKGLEPMAYVFHTEMDRAPAGSIDPSLDGTRLIFTPIAEDGSRIIIENACYIELKANAIQYKRKVPVVLDANMTRLPEPVSEADAVHVMRSYYGQRKADALIEIKTLG